MSIVFYFNIILESWLRHHGQGTPLSLVVFNYTAIRQMFYGLWVIRLGEADSARGWIRIRIGRAVVLKPANAALLAAKILGLSDPAVRAKVVEYQKKQADKILADDAAARITA